VLGGGTWARMCWRMSPSVSREVTVSGDPGLACPSLLLVPWLVLRWRAAAERRSYEEWCRAQWSRRNRRVCRSAVAQIDVRLTPLGLCLCLLSSPHVSSSSCCFC
jgi:hypothetical protein